MFDNIKRTWRILTGSEYEQYEHHGNVVWVRWTLRGRHRECCLCFACSKFFPSDVKKNCKIAQKIYSLCVEKALVLPVWECPEFARKKA